MEGVLVWCKAGQNPGMCSYCSPCCLSGCLKPNKHMVRDCCISLLWFKGKKILEFPWKPLLFRWPGNPVASHCYTQPYHNIQSDRYSWRHFRGTMHQNKELAFRSWHCIPPLPFFSLSFLILSRDFKIAGALFLKQTPVDKVWLNINFLCQILNFLSQSLRFQMTDSSLNGPERTSFLEIRLKSMWLSGRLLAFFSSFKKVNQKKRVNNWTSVKPFDAGVQSEFSHITVVVTR